MKEPKASPRRKTAYNDWMESRGVPIYEGHFAKDLRTIELAWWEERKCNAAFLALKGMEGVSEGRIVEIPPGKASVPMKLSIGELVYVLKGQGLTSVWNEAGGDRQTFEWTERSLFHIPRHMHHQIFNGNGEEPVRLLHYNYMPVAMSVIPDPDFHFSNPYSSNILLNPNENLFADAKEVLDAGKTKTPIGCYWYGHVFPDLGQWDKLTNFEGRGAGGQAVWMKFPDDEMGAHMSVFDPGLYKKGHRHGPGRVIVIPAGEGYSILWRQGGEKVVCPWSEATVFVPPEDWYHQHFNTGKTAARYLALGPLRQFRGKGETPEDRLSRQIEYTDEDPWIRKKFAEELAKTGTPNLMPEQAYTDPTYEWDFGDDD
jgi:oxalate decarboxylase/phosphoglucose isomerase-like protein (cupin superfamily)